MKYWKEKIERTEKAVKKSFSQGHFPTSGLRYSMLWWGSTLVFCVVIMVGFSIKDTIEWIDSLVFQPPPGEYDMAIYRKVRLMTLGYPIRNMASSIASFDSLTAAYIVAIAKKESNWGKISPQDVDGTHCYNYWGFRLSEYERVTPNGYTCFSDANEAVQIVGERIREMIHDQGRNTTDRMVVWKCGFDCSDHSDASVSKWIADVEYYVQKMVEE